MNLMIRQDSNPSLSISLPYSFHHVSHSSIIFYSLPLFHHLFPSSSVFPINVWQWEPILSRLHPLVPKEKYQAFIDLAIRDFLSSCRREGGPFSMTRKLQETTVARPWARGVSRGSGMAPQAGWEGHPRIPGSGLACFGHGYYLLRSGMTMVYLANLNHHSSNKMVGFYSPHFVWEVG